MSSCGYISACKLDGTAQIRKRHVEQPKRLQSSSKNRLEPVFTARFQLPKVFETCEFLGTNLNPNGETLSNAF